MNAHTSTILSHRLPCLREANRREGELKHDAPTHFLLNPDSQILNPEKNAFTLIELMITLVIIVIILSAVYGSFFAAARTTESCRRSITAVRESRALIEKISRQLRSTYYSAQVDVPEKQLRSAGNIHDVEHQPNPSRFKYTIEKDIQTLRFATTAALLPDKKHPYGPFCVTYTCNPETSRLTYTQIPLHAPPRRPPRKHILADNLSYCGFHFARAGEWFDTWPPDNQTTPLPDAVKMNMTCVTNTTSNNYELITTLNINLQ